MTTPNFIRKGILVLFVTACFQATFANADGVAIPYYKSKGILESKLVKEKTSYTEYDLLIDETDPRTKLTLKVRAHYYKNKKAGKLPLLILVPPINGVSSRENSVTHHFISKGYSTIVIEPVKNISDSSIALHEFENNLLSFVGAVRSVIDVMVEKPEVDSSNVFIWASSMGAIYSSIVIGEDKRINAGILIVAGGSIGDIVTDSKQKHIVKYKNERMVKESLKTNDDFRKKINENLKIDPCTYAKCRPSSDIFFVMSANDKSVPSKYQKMLYESFGSPTHFKVYRKGHGKVIIKAHRFKLNDYSDFTDSKLKK